MNIPAVDFIKNIVREPEAGFYDITYGQRIVISKLPKKLAEVLSKQMGTGYSTQESLC
jgi:hypothetical protein